MFPSWASVTANFMGFLFVCLLIWLVGCFFMYEFWGLFSKPKVSLRRLSTSGVQRAWSQSHAAWSLVIVFILVCKLVLSPLLMTPKMLHGSRAMSQKYKRVIVAGRAKFSSWGIQHWSQRKEQEHSQDAGRATKGRRPEAQRAWPPRSGGRDREGIDQQGIKKEKEKDFLQAPSPPPKKSQKRVPVVSREGLKAKGKEAERKWTGNS